MGKLNTLSQECCQARRTLIRAQKYGGVPSGTTIKLALTVLGREVQAGKINVADGEPGGRRLRVNQSADAIC